MRGTLIGICVLLSCALGSPSAQADDLTGTWNVVSRPAWDSCGSPMEKSVYQWLIAQNGDAVTVSVLGTTGFPDLSGKLSGALVRLEGESRTPLGTGVAGVYAASIFELSSSGGKLVGTRYYLGSRARRGGGTRVCMSVFDVEATKQ